MPKYPSEHADSGDDKKAGSHNEYGLSHRRPFLSYIKGYKRLQDAAWDAMQFHNEMQAVIRKLFPAGGESEFSIQHGNHRLVEDLVLYFLKCPYGLSEHLYGQACRLPSFLRGIAQDLLIEGQSFRAMDWGQKDIRGATYVLPLRFRYLRTSTMRAVRKRGRIVGFRQKYSWVGRQLNKNTLGADIGRELRKVTFKASDVFHTRYPFARESPAQISLRFVRKVLDFWDFSAYRSKGSARPEIHTIRVERARFRAYNQEKRKFDLARGKISKNFNYLYEGKITQFYDVHQVVQFHKRLNDFRSYLVRQFNDQVLNTLALKNKLTQPPAILIRELMPNEKIEKIHEMFKRKEISLEQFIAVFRLASFIRMADRATA